MLRGAIVAVQSTTDDQHTTQSLLADAGGRHRQSPAADLFYFSAMAVVGVAAAIATFRNFQTTLTFAASVGAGLFIACVAIHIGVRRRPSSQSVAEKASRAAGSGNTTVAPAESARASAKLVEPVKPPARNVAAQPQLVARGAGFRPAEMSPLQTLSRPTVDIASFWNLRPGDQDLPALNWRQATAPVPKGTPAGEFAALASLDRDRFNRSQDKADDAAAVNAILQRLAQDISVGRARLHREGLAGAHPAHGDSGVAETSTWASSGAVSIERREQRPQGDDFESLLIEALNQHRPAGEPSAWMPFSASPEASPADDTTQTHVKDKEPDPASPMTDTVTALAAALAAEKVSVFLEPIQAFDRKAPQHYELTLRLRLGDGSEVARENYSPAASGTAVLPLIDTVALVQARRLVWSKTDADPDGRLFTAVSGETVLSDQFSDDFERMVARDGAFPRRIVLSLDQADARLFTEAHLSALKQLSATGIVFALDAVTDLDMDFEALVKAGFRFVKLDADVFLDGLPVDTARIPSEDICRHLGGVGLLTIVGHIRDADQLEQLKRCGVMLGQGPLFGDAQIVRAEVPQTN